MLYIGTQLASGLSVLHEHKIIHRDLALRNLFVHCNEKGELAFKLGDFGLCLDLGDIKTTGDAVKHGIHVAPEKVYSEKSDVYALGLVFYGEHHGFGLVSDLHTELLSLVDLSKDTLYAHNTTTLAAERKDIEDDISSLDVQYSDMAQIVSRMLLQDVGKRITANEVRDQLQKLLDAMTAKHTKKRSKQTGTSTGRHDSSLTPVSDAQFRPWLVEVPRATAKMSTVDARIGAIYHDTNIVLDKQFTLRIIAKDALGQARRSGGEAFRVEFTSLLESKPAPEVKHRVVDKGTGVYDVLFTVAKPGKFLASVTLGGAHIKDSPLKLECLPCRQKGDFELEANIEGLAVGSDGLLYIAFNDHIGVYSSDGRELRRWGQKGSRDGEFNEIGGIAVGSDGLVFCTDQWVTNRVQVFRPDGTFVRKWGSTGTVPGEFQRPRGIAVDTKSNEVFVVDHDNARCQVFNCEGKYLRQFGSRGDNDGQFLSAFAIAVDEKDSVFITDVQRLDLVQMFDRSGKFIRKFFTKRHRQLEDYPNGIAVFSSDCVCVCDGGNHRIHIFDEHGAVLQYLICGVWLCLATKFGTANVLLCCKLVVASLDTS